MDHDDLMAAMYSDDDDAQPSSKPIDPGNLRTRKIRVGIVEYEVPTPDYVRHLEQLVLQQAHNMQLMQREMARLRVELHGTRHFVNRQSDNIADLRRDLTSRRVDLR